MDRSVECSLECTDEITWGSRHGLDADRVNFGCAQAPANLTKRHSFEPFPRFVQLLEGPALYAGGSRRLDVADGKLAKMGGRPFTGGKAQAAFHGSRKPLVDNPESVFRRDGRQSCVVTENLIDAVFADEREQTLMDIPELDLSGVLLPNHNNAVVGFIVDDGADWVVPKILQQVKAIAGILSQFFAQLAQMVTILGWMTEHALSLSSSSEIRTNWRKYGVDSLFTRE